MRWEGIQYILDDTISNIKNYRPGIRKSENPSG